VSRRRRRLAAGVCLLSLGWGLNFGLGASRALADCLQSCGPSQRERDLIVSQGTRTLSDEDLDVKDVTVGGSGPTWLIIERSSDLESRDATVGTKAKGAATVELTGAASSWTNSSDMTVGLNGGTGTVTVSDGGALATKRLALSTGSWDSGKGGNGTLEVTGVGTGWTNTDGVEIGLTAGSVGVLKIADGATVNLRNVGIAAGAGAAIAITGDGTRVEIGNPKNLKNPASLRATGGTVAVSDGAYLYSSNIYVGADGENLAQMTVSGEDTVVETETRFYVGGQYGLADRGGNGRGTLTVSNGASITAATVGTGMDPRSNGTILVTGDRSVLKAQANEARDRDGNFYIGYTGEGAVTVADGGAIEVDGELRIGTKSTGVGTLFIGGSDDEANAAGTVIADKVVFGLGKGEIVFNHTSSDYEFAAALSGSGIVTALAGTTVLTGDSSDFTGTLNVTGGVLDMNGANGAAAVVEDGATLKGNGTVGSVDARANSVVAPGNSPGTLTVLSDYRQADGSIYRAELVPGSNQAAAQPDHASNDLIAIGGKATLEPGAILDVVKDGDERYRLDARYEILTADDGITGTYKVQGDTRVSQFYELLADYQPRSVSLISTQTSTFDSAALTVNQFAVAETLEALDSYSEIRGAVGIVQTAEEARLAFDQLSGEVYASAGATLLDDSRFLREAIGRQVTTETDSEGPVLWTQAYGSWANADSDGNAAGFDRNVGGVFFGADGDLTDALRLGFVGGYGNTSLNAAEGRGSVSIDSYSLGLYGAGSWDRLNFSMGVAQSWHEISSERGVRFDEFQDQLSADYNGRSTQVFAELGYRLDPGPVVFEPFVGLAYVNADTDGFVEDGGVAALRGAGVDAEATYSTVGLRTSSHFDVAGVPLAATGAIGWRHNFNDTTVGSIHGFDIGNSFAVSSASFGRDVGFVEAGLSADLGSNARLSFAYSGQFGKEITESGVKVRFDVSY
jgi:outer membrane autotransporter protein